uniref:Envelope protein n=1 Tax=Athene cunicularia TaxID=194338 RepID=A0A663N0B8_ATHCN
MEGFCYARWTFSFLSITFLPLLVTQAWETNTLYKLHSHLASTLNLSDCWMCTALPRGNLELPLLGIPVSYTNWSWPYDNLNNSTLPTGESIVWNLESSCAPGQIRTQLPNGRHLCWGRQSPMPPKDHRVPKYTCRNSSIYPLTFDLQVLERPVFIKRNNDTAPKVGSFSFNLTKDLNGTVCERGKNINDTHKGCPLAVTLGLWLNYSYSCTPDGLWWLCGDGRARKSLPDFWDGVCTLGYVIPQNRIYNRSHPPSGIIRTRWRKVREIPINPLIQRPTAFHSFVRWFLPWIGVSELEKAIVNISAILESLSNSTTDAIQALQEEVSSLSKVTLQNRLGLDMLFAQQGGLCTAIGEQCCTYINQNSRVETDLQQTRFLHLVTLDDTSWGFQDLWERLTSWLPNFKWLKQLLLTAVLLLFLALKSL